MKIAVDTNIVLRIMTGDDEKLLNKARNLIRKYAAGDIFVSSAVLMETYYVLSKQYHFTPDHIINAFEDFMKIEQFYFEHETAIRLALVKLNNGLSFNDSVIGEIGASKNLKTYTFDKGLKKDPTFIILAG